MVTSQLLSHSMCVLKVASKTFSDDAMCMLVVVSELDKLD